MKDDQLSLVIQYPEHQKILEMAELMKKMVELMKDSQLYLLLHILKHHNALKIS